MTAWANAHELKVLFAAASAIVRERFRATILRTVADAHDGSLVGLLIDLRAFESTQRALTEARESSGIVHGGERIEEIGGEKAYYVRSALCEMPGAYWSRTTRNLCADPLRIALFPAR